ncbi:phospholipase D-like domain-containing protein [Massilia niastensis]|uniref:phospholipase D-like domain-containing protein n=1 Tax=Massilia niastensis TaxID=544911 RepID=UPI00035E6467|nr:phospholipase D-like domain-containing protein [Massilia niastensis]
MGMEENEGLYTQKLCYNQAVGPYQCLSLPWWVRTSKHKTYLARHHCRIEPLICGEEVFGSIQKDLLAARGSVDIITWGFDPGMVLVRGSSAEDGMRYGDLLKQISTRKENPVAVRLLLWHDNAASYAIQKNNPGLYGTRIPTIGAYAGYFGETHDRYNRVWFDEIIANKVPNIVLRTREVALKFRGPALAGEKYKISPIDGRAGSIYPTHHQKMILIDYETPARAVGYVMGHNSTTDFWDTARHRFQDRRRETLYRKNPAEAIGKLTAAMDETQDWYERQVRSMSGQPEQASRRKAERLIEFISQYGFTAKPYQDVSLRVRGSILYDMNHNFCHGWEESEPGTPALNNAIWMTPPGMAGVEEPVAVKATDQKPATLPALVQSRRHLKAADFALKDCHHSAQLLRTYPAYQEKSIKECYANLTRLTHHYIFIQNQYIQYEEWATYLTACIEKLRSAGYTKPIYVFILTSTPETDGMDLATYDVALQLGRSETMKVEHEETVAKARRGKAKMPITAAELEKRGIRALMASMWSGAEQPKSPKDYEETYIHAKVAIVDDAAFTVGSANLNVRSMVLDSELNLLSQAMDVAFDLRRKLFKQCTNDEGPALFGDMGKTFDKWLDLMQDNTDAMAKGRPLKGQIATFHVDREPGPPVI